LSTDATKHYSTREAARILATTETRVRSWARLGGLESKQGADERTEFTFQELLLLRTTRGLLDAGIPAHRVRRVWSSLRRQLAADLPLTSVRILADGARAVAWDENASWQPDSGQFLLDFDAEELAGRAEALPALAMVDAAGPLRDVAAARATPSAAAYGGSVAPTAPTASPASVPTAASEAESSAPEAAESSAPTAEQWFHLACELEETSPLEARQAYLQAIALDPSLADAHLNLGRLEHEAGELGKAEMHYRRAVQCDPDDAIAHYNLAVLLEDRGHEDEAIQAYAQAIARDPEGAADAHYNLGLLMESRGRRDEAMRHLMAARRLYEVAGPKK